MTVFLPRRAATANRKIMRGRITNLFVLLALIFSAVIVPATAHAQDLSEVHANDMLTNVDHSDHETPDHDGDLPCHAVVHHHCSVALAYEGHAVTSERLATGEVIPLAASPAMSSFAQAPPTEPPAA